MPYSSVTRRNGLWNLGGCKTIFVDAPEELPVSGPLLLLDSEAVGHNDGGFIGGALLTACIQDEFVNLEAAKTGAETDLITQVERLFNK